MIFVGFYNNQEPTHPPSMGQTVVLQQCKQGQEHLGKQQGNASHPEKGMLTNNAYLSERGQTKNASDEIYSIQQPTRRSKRFVSVDGFLGLSRLARHTWHVLDAP